MPPWSAPALVLRPVVWRWRMIWCALMAGRRPRGSGLIRSQAGLSSWAGSRQPSSARIPLMSWDRAAKPSVIDQKPSRRSAFMARLRSVAMNAHAVVLAVAMSVLSQLGVSGPVPGVFDRPSIPDVPQQCRGCGPETRDVVTDLVDGLPLTDALASHRKDRGTARPVLHHPRRRRHAPQRPGEVTPALALTLAGLKWHPTAVGEPFADHLRSFAATVFDGDQEVGAALLEVVKKPRFACSASACTNKPSSSTGSRSCRRAAISPPASVA